MVPVGAQLATIVPSYSPKLHSSWQPKASQWPTLYLLIMAMIANDWAMQFCHLMNSESVE